MKSVEEGCIVMPAFSTEGEEERNWQLGEEQTSTPGGQPMETIPSHKTNPVHPGRPLQNSRQPSAASRAGVFAGYFFGSCAPSRPTGVPYPSPSSAVLFAKNVYSSVHSSRFPAFVSVASSEVLRRNSATSFA